MSKTILELNNITMQFGGVVAVDNLSLHVDEGEIVALIGPNGAGKTTAFNVVTSMYPPTNGQVLLNGKPIVSNHPHGKMKKMYAGCDRTAYPDVVTYTPDKITKMRVARTFQNIRLFKDMSVLDNVLIAKHMNIRAGVFSAMFRLNKKEESDMHESARALLSIVGLLPFQNEIAGSLPYGKQRYLEIARALATEPQLLLLDEPAAGMNPQETDELGEFIRRIRDAFRLTVFMIEHHMDLVMKISDRIYVIDFGKQISKGSPAQVQSDPAVIAAYLGEDEE
ncbi:MAG: ABC transporter ATP-binding protein [Clostridiales bacterium]|jgi:branched-chain amino acid transport system ATP-binding protein|nr:ABC transporter ATP-binding protein [Clostridiales bacterium]